MRSVSIRQLDMKNATIPLGFEGENDFTEVRIDCKKTFDQHPNAVPSMTVTDPAGNKYPAVVTRDGDIVVWQLTAGDLTTKGYGEIQIEFIIDGTVIGKTDIARTRIERSIFPEGEAPEPVQNWLDEANQTLAEVEEAKKAFPAGGTTGQVLTKKSDEDYDAEWKTPQGGGGGTSNYNDLDNKPSIGGVTLSGDVSLDDIGAAKAEDIPDVSGKMDEPETEGTQGQVLTTDGNGGRSWQTPGGGSITVDDELSDNSTNPVQNKVITGAVEELKEAIENVQDEIESILVEEEDAGPEESATLTNAVTISNIAAQYGVTKTSSSGVVPLVFESTGTDKYLSFQDNTLRLSSGKKWLVGFNSKAIKSNPSLESPPNFRLAFGSNYFPYDSTYGQWVNYAEVYEGEIKSVVLTHMNYPTKPGENEVSIEVKDYYAYDVTGLSENLINYIKEQQSTNFTDGTVTYTIGGGSGGFAPDTTLSEEGKVPDSKVVGDAISEIAESVKPPLDKNLQGVAFGTSLTARAVSGDGYMDYLPDLIGIEFDNQGITSAEIYGSILTTIKGYTGYASKDVCIIEGFVNDWAHDKTLGTWKDTTENSSCGCLRSAINYILAQNPNITMFIVFDHYGRSNSGEDFSSTAQNTANLTQFEFYEEMAKVAKSLGIPVIAQHEGSQISENTPQYLADYIHDNALGAKQSANFIFSKMKQYFQNEQPLT